MGSDPVRVALFGLGGVGRAFLELAAERRGTIRLVAAADSAGSVVGAPLDPREVMERKASGTLAEGATALEPLDVIERSGAEIVVDLSSCDFWTGEPSRTILSAAIGAGVCAVTVNKAPLVRSWTELVAPSRGRLRYSAAAGAALPAVAAARALARVDELESIEGVLTGTTTFVLDEMSRGLTLEEAVAAARASGIAEPDPSIDLGGWDTAAKLVILSNTVWADHPLSLEDVEVRGVEAVQPEWPAGHACVRVIGRAERRNGRVIAAVAPASLSQDHPLSVLRGSDKGVVFRGPAIGQVCVTGGRSHPRGAAAAAFGDVYELAEDRA